MPRPESSPPATAVVHPHDDASKPALSMALVLRTMRKHVLLVLAVWATLVVLAVFWSLGQTRVYRAESMIRLDPDPPKPLGQRVELISAQQGNYFARREFYETEYRVLRSMRVATAVVRALGLNADPGFLHVKSSDRKSFRPWSVEDAARLLISRLAVEPVKDSSLAFVRYEDTDTKRAQLVLNTVVRTYLAQNLEANSTLSTSANEWLNAQLDHLKVDLESSEKALNDFRQKNKVLSISLEDRHNMIAAQLEQVAKEITSLEIKRAELAARVAELKDFKSTDPSKAGVSELLHSPVLSTLRTSYAEQVRTLDELSASLGENHPKVLAAKAKLDATSKAIATEISNIQSAAGKDLRAVDRQLGELRKKEDELQKQAHELQAFEVVYNQLNRTKTYNEKIYGLVLERARETDLTRVMNFNNIRVVDEATEPRQPVRPNVPLNVALGAVVGFLLGIGTALLRELSDRSLKTPHDVEVAIGVPCLGLLPEIEAATTSTRGRRRPPPKELADRDLIVAQRPESGVAEAARAIRTNLTFTSPDRPYRTMVVTSAVPEEGKTTVACSIATVLAQSGLRVLLVDTDLRRPRLRRAFKLPTDAGVTLAISGQAPLDDCIHETSIPNLSVLPAGPIPPNPAELLQSDRFRELTRTLHAKFDRVVYDSPPILPVTDAAVLAQLVDGVVVIARGFRTPKSATRQAVRQLLDVKAHVIGVVLNAIDLSRHDYRDYHYYYKRDGYYSADRSETEESSSEHAGIQ